MNNRSILLFCFIIFISSIGVVHAQDCSILGKWQKTDGFDTYTFYEDGTGQALFGDKVIEYTWGTQNGTSILNWTDEPEVYFLGTATILNDCQSLNGTNNDGTLLNAVRINQPPIAIPDVYTLEQDSVLTITEPGVLLNDLDPDRNNLTASVVSNPLNGDLHFNPNGSFTYTPLPEWYGNVTFLYKMNDGVAESAITPVWISVNRSARPAAYFIKTSIRGNGAFSPQGDVLVPSGGNQSIEIMTGNMSWLSSVTIDNITLGGGDFIGLRNLVFTFKNVGANHTVSAECISPPHIPGS